MSDTIAEQVPLVPNENLRAPIEKNAPKKPSIPPRDQKIADKAKAETIKEEEQA